MAAPVAPRARDADQPDYRSVCKTQRKDTGMKAQELRLGNYVHDRNGNVIRIDFFEHLENGFDCKFGQRQFLNGEQITPLTEYTDHATPIQLNEEWLVKAGANKIDDILDIFELDRFQLFPFYTYGFWKVIDKETKAYITKVSYIHELQNMYFVLNGEELPL